MASFANGWRAGAIAFVAVVALAEAARPTHLHAKKIASRALLVRAQSVPDGARDSLDPELLADLPRIFPDASATIASVAISGATVTLSGRIDDPFERAPGLAVFATIDGIRGTSGRIRYAAPEGDAFAIVTGPLAPGDHDVGIGVVTADQRGCFLGPARRVHVSTAR